MTVNGKTVEHADMAYIYRKLAINMRVNLKKTNKTAMAQ